MLNTDTLTHKHTEMQTPNHTWQPFQVAPVSYESARWDRICLWSKLCIRSILVLIRLQNKKKTKFYFADSTFWLVWKRLSFIHTTNNKINSNNSKRKQQKWKQKKSLLLQQRKQTNIINTRMQCWIKMNERTHTHTHKTHKE